MVQRSSGRDGGRFDHDNECAGELAKYLARAKQPIATGLCGWNDLERQRDASAE